MPEYTSKIRLEDVDAARVLDTLNAKAQQLEATLERIAGKLGASAGQNAEFQGAARELAATQGAISAVNTLSTSVTYGGVGSSALAGAVKGGATAGVGAFQDIVAATTGAGTTPGAQVYLEAVKAAASVSYNPPFQANDFVRSVMASAQPVAVSAQPTGGTRQFNVSDLLPQAFEKTQAFAAPVVAPPATIAPAPGAIEQYAQWASGFRGYGPLANVDRTTLMSIGFGVNQAASVFADYGNLYAQQVLTGHRDIMGQGQLLGSTLGSMIGGVAGFMWGGGAIGGAFGMSAGGAVGGAIGRMLTAETEAGVRANVNLMGAGRVRAALFGDYSNIAFTPDQNGKLMAPAGGVDIPALRTPTLDYAKMLGGDRYNPGFAFTTSNYVKAVYGGGNIGEDYGPSRDEVASAYNAISAGFVEGGIDPTSQYGAKPLPGPFPAQPARPGTLINSTIDVAQRVIQSQYGEYGQQMRSWGQMYREAGTPDELAKWLTRNLALRTGRSVEESAKTLQPMLASLPESGGNMADMLLRYGVTSTNLYTEAWTPFGSAPDVSIHDLMGASSLYRSGARLGSFGATLARGSGAFMGDAADMQMTALSALPGGTDSLAYAQARVRRREAWGAAFGQESLLSYAIPRSRLAAEREIMDVLPYAPGLRMGNAMATVSLNRQRQGVISGYMNARAAAGDLSEAEQATLMQESFSLSVENAHAVATMVSGAAERLPAITAGRPAGFRRFDSSALAALNFGRAGLPRWDQGAVNGGELRWQDDFVRSFGLEPGELGARSRTGGVNRPGGGDAAILDALNRIAGLLERMGGNSRPAPGVHRGERFGGGYPERGGPRYSDNYD